MVPSVSGFLGLAARDNAQASFLRISCQGQCPGQLSSDQLPGSVRRLTSVRIRVGLLLASWMQYGFIIIHSLLASYMCIPPLNNSDVFKCVKVKVLEQQYQLVSGQQHSGLVNCRVSGSILGIINFLLPFFHENLVSEL